MNKDTSIIIRTTKELKERISDICKKHNINLSEYLNAVMLDTVHKEKIPLSILGKINANKPHEYLDISKIKKTLEKVIAAWGKDKISKAYLFGSFSRGEQTINSDVDIRLITDEGFSMFDIGFLRSELETSLKRKVDILDQDDDKLDAYFLETLKRDQICIYERSR